MKKLTFKRTMVAAIALTTLLNAMPMVASASYTGGVTRAVSTATASVSVPGSDATLTFSNGGVTASGVESGYKIEGTALTISEAGVYTITGNCSDGSITVKKGVTGVTLILKDLSLASATTAPLSCNKETGVTLYAVGTVTLADKESLANEDADDFEGAAIKVKSGASLTISGTGTLTADGSACKNGIKGAAESTITVEGAVTLNIKAANNGLADDNEIIINGGTLNITADGDGIKAEPDEGDAVSKGTVAINGGSVTIQSQGDGIQATGDVTIAGGTFDIQTHGGASNAKQLGADDSAKGIKSDSKVIISGGTFALNSADDALHANGNVTVTGGSYAIQAGDDAFHADYDLTIGEKGGAGPEIAVSSSYEGLEGARIYLNSGKGSIVSSDDGVNAATSVSTNEIALYINGGEWTIDANGDGLDAGGDSGANSGGSIYINGGVTKVFGAPNGGNAALDYDATCEYNGGSLLTVDVTGMNQQPRTGTYVLFGAASGMGGMMGGLSGNMGQRSGNQRTEVFTANVSGQDSMARFGGMGQMGQQSGNGMSGAPSMGGQSAMGQQSNMGGQQAASASAGSVSISKGSSLEVKDSDGNTIVSATGTKTANVVMLCDDSLVSGETYTLYINGSAAATATATSGAQSGGMEQQMPGEMDQQGQPEQSGTQEQSFNPEQGQPSEQGQTFNPEQAPDMSNGPMGQQGQSFNPEQTPSANNSPMEKQGQSPMGQQVPSMNDGPMGQQGQSFNPEQAPSINNGSMGHQVLGMNNAPMGQQGQSMNSGPMGQQVPGMNNAPMGQQVPGMNNGPMGQQVPGMNNAAMGQQVPGMNNGPMGQNPDMNNEAFPFWMAMYR